MNAFLMRARRALLAAAVGILLLRAAVPVAQDRPAGTLGFDPIWTAEQLDARVAVFNGRLPAVPGEILVKFREGFGPAAEARALSVLRGGVAAGEAQWLAGGVLQVRAAAEPDAALASAILAQQPEVEWAQPNYVSRFMTVPNDPAYSMQWNLATINMPAAWDISQGGSSSVPVAVIDTGVTVTNAAQTFPLWNGQRVVNTSVPFRQDPDIAAARFGTSRDFVFWTGPVLDMEGHGTHVAGTVLQETNNNFGNAGIAYNALLMPLKACVSYWDLQVIMSALNRPGFLDPNETGFCDTASVISAIRYAADSGARVINMSFGGPSPSPGILDALRYAVQHGSFVAIAIGNEFEEGNPTEYPAAYAPQIDGVMSVGAVGRSRRRAFYSNTNSALEIVAPGGDSRDGGASGVVYQQTIAPADSDPFTVIFPRFDRFQNIGLQGTSMATPHVAGVAALLYAQGITDPAAIEAAIRRFAVDLGAAGRDNEYGYGLIDARAALRGLGVAR